MRSLFESICEIMKWLTSSSAQYDMCDAMVLMGLKSSTLLEEGQQPRSPVWWRGNTYSWML